MHTDKRRMLFLILGILAVCLVASILVLEFWNFGMCEDEVYYQVSSPDGNRKAIAFNRGCGATTGFNFQASLVHGGQNAPQDSGIVFVADHDHGAVALGPRGQMNVKIRWESNTQLVITYPEKARIFRKEEAYAGVSIRYETTK